MLDFNVHDLAYDVKKCELTFINYFTHIVTNQEAHSDKFALIYQLACSNSI